ncbi:MAG: DUF4199 domain-containing protein [Bacteroidetes bacterium]|nr:DUF4199 domain-containing protein [Bacteroidota bacterium]
MEQNNPTQLKTAMNYGAAAGLSIIVLQVLFYLIDISSLQDFLDYILIILFIVLGLRNYRDKHLGGFISYGKSLGTGTLIIFFCGILAGFFNYVFHSFIDPGQFNSNLNLIIEQMENSGTPEEQVDMFIKMMTPFTFAVAEVMGYTLLGFIFSLIIALFIRKTDDSFESEMK